MSSTLWLTSEYTTRREEKQRNKENVLTLFSIGFFVFLVIFIASLVILIIAATKWIGNDCARKYSCEISCVVDTELQPNYYQLRNCTDVVIDDPYHVILSTDKVYYPQDAVEVFVNSDNDNCKCPGVVQTEHYHHDVSAYSSNNVANIHVRLMYLYITIPSMSFCIMVFCAIILCKRRD